MTIEKIKILGTVLELLAKQHRWFGQFALTFFGYIISVLVSVGDAVKSFFFLPAYFLIGFQEALLLVCQADILRV